MLKHLLVWVKILAKYIVYEGYITARSYISSLSLSQKLKGRMRESPLEVIWTAVLFVTE